MDKKRFTVFILSHGRPNNVKTLKALQKGNYTGDWYIVIDNEDKTANEYYKRFGRDKVIMFDKLAVSKTFDTADNFKERRTVVYARNACFGIARELGYKYFLELDDDYVWFSYRKIVDGKFIKVDCKNIDKVFNLMMMFLDISGAASVAFAQGGDFIGGKDNKNYSKGIIRKAMNSFFCRTDREFKFIGRVNEDVNTYCKLGNMGELFFTITRFCLVQEPTQKQKGGMSEQYLDSGTYLKSFYPVMLTPSCITISMMGEKHKRLHHKIMWDKCVPKILSDKYKKA